MNGKVVLFCLLVGSIVSCTPSNRFRDRLKKAGSFINSGLENINVPEEVEFKAESVDVKANILQLPRVSPRGDTWLPRTLMTRDLKIEWSQDHKRVLVRGSAQWNNPSSQQTGDVPFVLAGNWNAESGITDLVAVSSETKAKDLGAEVRGRIYCIETDDQGVCSSSVVEVFVRVNGVIFSGQIEKLSEKKTEPPTPEDLEDSKQAGSHDEIEGFDQDLEAVGTNEEELDDLYTKKEIEHENDQIDDQGVLPSVKPPTEEEKLPKVVEEDKELQNAMDDVGESPDATMTPQPKATLLPTALPSVVPKVIPTTGAQIPFKELPKIPEKAPSSSVQPSKELTKLDPLIVPTMTVTPRVLVLDIPKQKVFTPISPVKKESSRPLDLPQGKASQKEVVATDSGVPSVAAPKATLDQSIDGAVVADDRSEKERAKFGAKINSSIPTVPPVSAEIVERSEQAPAPFVAPVVPAIDGDGVSSVKTEPGDGNPGKDQNDSKKQIDQKYHDQSVGAHSRGSLRKATSLKAVVEKMAERSRIRVVHPEQNRFFGNYASIEFLVKASILINRLEPDHYLEVDDISAAKGGRLRPHKSHQSGLDMDLGFFLKGILKGYYGRKVVEGRRVISEFDRSLHWKFFKALMTHYHDKIYFILLHPAVKKAMCEEAVKSGDIVKGKEIDPIVMHTLRRLVPESSHYNHFHVRLKCPDKDSRCVQTTRDLPMTMGCFAKK